MSATKRLAVVVIVLAALSVIHAASAHAQACPTNPSGGTWLRQTTEEGSGPAMPGGFLSSGAGWRNWLATYAATRYASAVASRPSAGRGLLAVTRRASGGR
jgi:hypothetical protein